MKPLAAALLVLVAVGWFWSPMAARDGARAASQSAPAGSLPAVIDAYCAGCHNGRSRSPSGVLLEAFDTAQIPARLDLWSRAYRQLQARTMPPGGAPRPDRATYDATLLAIEKGLGAHDAARGPGADDSQAIATRLASLVWNSAPDAALTQDALRGHLSDPATLERQVRRLLADDRALAFVSRFFVPWLQLDELAKADPDTKYFPGYDVSLREALAKETELFLLSQLREDRDPLELWTAEYTFVNQQLATHYGIANVTGPQFRRVPVPGPERSGLLGHGSVLMVTSRHQHGVDAAYTTPATRAKWVRLHFLGAPLPNGFPGAQPVKPELPITPQTRTLAATPCVNCHRDFFPLGYALENFDPLGRWRTHDQAGPVDVSGELADGSSTHGAVALRKALLQYPEAARTTVAERLLVYAATGLVGPAGGTPDTLVRARRILRGMPAPRWSGLIAAVVRE